MTQVLSATREITVGQLAERSGVTVSALHFYEAKGLISARRTAGNQRRYPRAMLRRVAFIRAWTGLACPRPGAATSTTGSASSRTRGTA